MKEFRIPFLILGFTGPICSGCTTMAKNIERMLPRRWIEKQNLLDDVNQRIYKRSNDLKDMISKSFGQQDGIKAIYKEIKDCYNERLYLKILNNLEDTRFIYISMSILIVKLAIENVNTPEFLEWKKSNDDVAEILESAYNKWSKTIEAYNKSKNACESLNGSDLKEIDEMFKSIDKACNQIKNIEMQKAYTTSLPQKAFCLQEFGDNLRGTSNPFISISEPIEEYLTIVAREVNKYIKYYRHRNDDKRGNCFVIDAFRNPAEVEFFRRRYDQFYLVSLYANKSIRAKRFDKQLKENYIPVIDDEYFANERFKWIDEKDWGEGNRIRETHKQNVARCCYLSDIAVNNDENLYEFDINLFKKFLKYLALIISPGCIQPTKEETFMNLAYSLSLRSSCISRQVGAVITDKDGYVLGQGWNDVGHGQIGCGLLCKSDYTNEDSYFCSDIYNTYINKESLSECGIKDEEDAICFKDLLSQSKISKKLRSIIYKGLPDMLSNKISNVLSGRLPNNEVMELIEEITNHCDDSDLINDIASYITSNLKVKRLEYCRALHAEENALLQVASRGGNGVFNGVIYTTTYPCELCAKKIYQSGIRKIYYTEPYPNSISQDVFLKDGIEKIDIRQFEGVNALSYYKLYKSQYDRKDSQVLDD